MNTFIKFKMNKMRKPSKINFGSKAYTLLQLQDQELSFTIPACYTFSYEQWQQNSEKILQETGIFFSGHPIAVRSSALCEDGAVNSYAGAFTSVLNVNSKDPDSLSQSIEAVFSSYPEKNNEDQVLLQEMVTQIDASGVILTRCVDDGSPYYVLNYDDESGNSESITSGSGVHKTVLVYRKYRPEYCDSLRVRKMLELANEVEDLCGWIPLDIEFALDKKGIMHLLQVRRISTTGNWHPDAEHRVSRMIPQVESFVSELSTRRKGLFGDFTVFGNMPDWNPAELIGVLPSPLAASLFRLLISSHAWNEGRSAMGYRRLPQTELMVMIGGRVFIDVRASFNSFLPAGIPGTIGEKLINAWLSRLAEHPSLHDKIEFEVAQTILDFSFEENFVSRYSDVLKTQEKQTFKELLLHFTNQALELSEKGSLAKASASIQDLALRQKAGALSFETGNPTAIAAHIAGLLEDCRQNGTIPFTILARHAFIAEAFLRSSVARGAITDKRVAEFKASFRTIMGDLAADTLAVCQGKLNKETFYRRFGHLRPGTFDILSPSYRDRSDLFSNCLSEGFQWDPQPFFLTKEETGNINGLLQDTGISAVDAHGLFQYARLAIQGREYGKFIFSRNLSEALEYIAEWGGFFNLGREDLSHLSIQDILDTCYASTRNEITSMLMHKVDQTRIDQSLARVFKLSYLVRGVRDIHVVPVHRSEPNFITQKQIEGSVQFLQATTFNYGSLYNTIICIENADPGFDWIFTKGILGLVTKYGGANSHMAIRCAELQLPAAIGCGEELFEKLRGARKIDLNCSARTIRKLGVYE